MTDLREKDICTLEVVIKEVSASGGGVLVTTSGGNTFGAEASDLRLLRRAPVDLATCEIGDGVYVSHREHPGFSGIMLDRLNKGKLFAFVDWESGEPGVCLVSDLEPFCPLDAPAPESEVETQWRDLALQFDAHRMEALWHIRAGLENDDARDAAQKFLAKPPLPGEAVLAERLASMAAPPCPPGHRMIGGIAVPEPMRDAPAMNTKYWVATVHAPDMVEGYHWTDDLFDQRSLKRGLCHLTREAAETHARALIAVSGGV